MNLDKRTILLEKCLRILLAAFVVALVMGAYPYTSDPTTQFKQLLTVVFSGLGGMLWILGVIFTGLPVRRPRIAFELLLCLLAFFVLSTGVVSEFKAYSLVELSIFIPLFVIYFLSSQVLYRREHLEFLIQWICVGVSLGSLYAFLQKFGADPFPWADKASDLYTNLPGMYGNPNFAAHTLILAIILAAYMLSVGKRGYLFPLALFFAHLYFTDQRAGLLALLASVLLLGVAHASARIQIKSSAKRAVFALGLTGVLGATALASVMLINSFRTGHPFPLDLSLLIRYQSYVSASNMLLEKPILGYGPGVYKISYPQYWTPFEQEWFAQENRMNGHVHNDLIELAIDAGLPAAGVYMALLLMGVCYSLLLAFGSKGTESVKLGYALAAFFTAFAVDGLFGFNLRVPVSAAIFFLGLGALDGLWSETPKQLSRLHAILFSAVLLSALFFSGYMQGRVFLSEYQLLSGTLALNSSDNASARAAFVKGEKWAPWNWVFSLRLGQIAKEESKNLEALDHFGRSLQANPFYIATHLAAAQSNLLLAQQQLDSMPSVSIAKEENGLSEAHLNVKSPLDFLKDGREHAFKILDLCPMYPRAQSTLGRISSLNAIVLMKSEEKISPFTVKKFWEDAEKHFEMAIAFGDANHADLYRLLARVRIEMGNFTAAEDALARAAQINPADALTWSLFFEFAKKHAQYDRLRNSLYASIGQLGMAEEENAVTLAHLNVWLAKTNEMGYQNIEATESAYAEALRLQPMDAGLWSQVGGYALEMKRIGTLETFVKNSCLALELAENRKPLDHIAAIYTLIQQGDVALNGTTEVLLAMYRAHPINSPLNPGQAYGWAVTYCVQRLQNTALPPEDICESNLNLGIMLTGMRDFETAEKMFASADSCISQKQRAIMAIYRADIWVAQGKTADAISLLLEAQGWDAENLDTRWAYARVLAQSGDIQSAKKAYESLLAEDNLDEDAKARLKAEYERLI